MPVVGSSSAELPVILLLLVAASVVALVVQRVRIPYTVLLVIVGIVVPSDALGLDTATALSPSIVLPIILPPLLFEAAFALRWHDLAPVGVAVAILATAGVAVCAVVTGGVLVLTGLLSWPVALLFGVLVAATDPVAVVAFFQRAPVAPQLRALVEGESLLNDGTAVVLVGVLGGLLLSGSFDPARASIDFIRVALGGLAVGAMVGVATSLLARGTSDNLVEATVSIVAAYGSYVIGDYLHVSGVLAVVAAGSVFGNFGRRFGLSAATEQAIDHLWRFLAFIANSLVFLLLGLAVVPNDFVRLGPQIALGVAATLSGRATVAYGVGTLVAIYGGVPPRPWRHILFWGGLRGALPVVIAIAITDEVHPPTIVRDLVLCVVATTLIIQGLTLELVIGRVLGSRTSTQPLATR